MNKNHDYHVFQYKMQFFPFRFFIVSIFAFFVFGFFLGNFWGEFHATCQLKSNFSSLISNPVSKIK